MERQTGLPTTGRKRHNDAASHEFRAHQSSGPSQLSICHAEASGSARMVNGTVGGNIIHGNNSNVHDNSFHALQVAYYYDLRGTAGDPDPNGPDPNGPDTYHSLSSVPSVSEKKTMTDLLHFPQLDSRLTNLRKAGRGTCEWLLRRKDYQEWTDMDSSNFGVEDGLFWIRGNPGTGKSITMKFLVQKMRHKLKRSRDELVLSFFFNARGSDLEKSTLGLYRSLLFGLLSSNPSLRDAFDHCSRSQCLSILSRGREQDHEQLLRELFQNAVDLLVSCNKRLYCYVDALDECEEGEIRLMLRYFEELMAEHESHCLRVCYSSRHYPQITVKTKHTITLEHEAHHNDDIRTYIKSELRFDEHTDQTEVGELRDAIFQKSAGIFLWVSLVVRQLNEVFDRDGRMDAIRDRLEEIPRAAKENRPSSGDIPLYELFRDVITKDRENVPALVRLTQLIFCARRPLRPQEAYVAIHQSYNEPFNAEKIDAAILSKHILSISKGLAELTRVKEPTVQFIHETVREFLRDCGLSGISEQSMNGDGNEVLKISCLDQINVIDSVAQHIDLLEDYHAWTSYRDKKNKAVINAQREGFLNQASRLFPFLQYATEYVLYHANAAAAQGVPQGPFLEAFPRHHWVPLHNLFEKANTKRYHGSDTTMLYILAGHGLNSLVQISTNQRNYADRYQNEQCQTALHNAIYSGCRHTARILVGLDPTHQIQGFDERHLNLSRSRKTLLRAILDSGDVKILRKVIQDLGVPYLQQDAAWAQTSTGHHLLLRESYSEAMIDCLAEHYMLPNTGPAGKDSETAVDADGNVSSPLNLFFIRRMIEKHPKLLTDDDFWNQRCMLDYAMGMGFSTLACLYFELMNSQGLATLNDCVERAALAGCRAAVEQAHDRGADLDFQDQSGRTLLHKMFSGDNFRRARQNTQGGLCSVLEYLVSNSEKLRSAVDKDGYTAFDLVRNDFWDYEFLQRDDPQYKSALEIFVKAGAATKKGFFCNDHKYPWLAVPWISVELSMKLTGEKHLTKLNTPDSLGRTALSWCFAKRLGALRCDFHRNCTAREKGLQLLKFPDVDVNSRDNSHRTILEHLIRHPDPYHNLGVLSSAFLKHSALDVNLETSDKHSPLGLIISLHDTWPSEFGDMDAEWYLSGGPSLKGMEKKSYVSQGLVKTAELLLATGRVDISEQKRCLAKAPNALQGLILESIKRVEPGYHI